MLRTQVTIHFHLFQLRSGFHFQIQEIRDEVLLGEKKRLGVLYGIDDKNLESPLDALPGFDLTRFVHLL